MKRIDYVEPIPLNRLALGAIHQYVKGKAVYNHGLLIEAFEEALCRYLKVKHCLCVNSGTTGLMLAIKALGLKGEVIVPSYSFCGTVHPLAWNGITPRFIDIDSKTFNLDLNQVKRNITPRTSAILAVHMYGNPCDVEALGALAKKHGLKLIFDAAHAFGSRYKGRLLGAFGDLEVFSLQTTKVLTVLEGGFISTNQESVYKKLFLLRRQGNRGDGNCVDVGLNARMHPLAAAMGLAGLKVIDKNIQKRRKLGECYYSLLSKIPGITLQEINKFADYIYQDIILLVDDDVFGLSRDALACQLEKRGISTRKYYHPPVHRYSCYSHLKTPSPLKVTDHVADNIVCLPFYSSMSFGDIEYICQTIRKIQSNHAAKSIKQRVRT